MESGPGRSVGDTALACSDQGYTGLSWGLLSLTEVKKRGQRGLSEVGSALTPNEEVQGCEYTDQGKQGFPGATNTKEPRRLVGKGRSGQHGVGRNLCLVKRQEGDKCDTAGLWGAGAGLLLARGKSPAGLACAWIWSCSRLWGPRTSPAVPWRATLLTFYCLPQP